MNTDEELLRTLALVRAQLDKGRHADVKEVDVAWVAEMTQGRKLLEKSRVEGKSHKAHIDSNGESLIALPAEHREELMENTALHKQLELLRVHN